MGSTLSVMASVAILRSTVNQFVPEEVRNYLWKFSRRFSSELTMVVKETHDGSTNHLFEAAKTYLGGHSFSATSDAPHRLTVGKNENLKILTYGLDNNSEIVDIFHGVPMKWKYSADYNSTTHFEIRWYELRFHKKNADMVKNKYLRHVLEVAKAIKDKNRVVKFYTVRRDGWCSNAINLDHPMTFGTIALDGDIKRRVLDDLDGFINGKEYYRKIGKVWKRGYLLHGPPGTGKSSLIAAMANYLNFDIYSLNLSAVNSDSTLECLLLRVTNRSILVIEDIDCSIKLQNRVVGDQPDQFPRPQVTLSGLLNAVDGLLSCCGNERIMVFTTNYKDRIDPALLRAGRMDMHICLSYCTFSTFKQLAYNYLEISNHSLFCFIEKLIGEIEVSPAEVAGELMKTKDPTTCLEGLIKFLESKGPKAQLSAAPLSASNLVENRPKEEDGNNPNQKDECQGKILSKMTDLQNGHSSNHIEEKFPALDSTSLKVGEYTIMAELEPILKAILLKYRDVDTNCSLQSIECRSSFLEILCDIIQTLQAVEFKNLTQPKIKSMLTKVHDLESVKLKVDWLHQRLDEISVAMQLVEYCSTLKEDRNKNVQDIEKLERELECCKAETVTLEKKSLQIQDKLVELKAISDKLNEDISCTEAKLNCFHHGSLVDGLL